MKTTLTPRQRARLDEAIDREIHKYERYRKLLRHVDTTVLKAGKDCFGSDYDLVKWLCEPARALNYQIPLVAMRTAAGRQKVANILCALDRGVFL